MRGKLVTIAIVLMTFLGGKGRVRFNDASAEESLLVLLRGLEAPLGHQELGLDRRDVLALLLCLLLGGVYLRLAGERVVALVRRRGRAEKADAESDHDHGTEVTTQPVRGAGPRGCGVVTHE